MRVVGGQAQARVNIRSGGGDSGHMWVWESGSCWSQGGGTAMVELDGC
jgi:hypothetical protein